MDAKINDLRYLNVLKEVSPQKIEQSSRFDALFAANLKVAMRHVTQTLGATGSTRLHQGIRRSWSLPPRLVARFEAFRILISIAALFHFKLCQFDGSAAYLHKAIDKGVYMEPPGHGKNGPVWLLLKGVYKSDHVLPFEHHVMHVYPE